MGGGIDNTGALRLIDPGAGASGNGLGSGIIDTLSGTLIAASASTIRVEGGGTTATFTPNGAGTPDQLNITGLVTTTAAQVITKNGPGQLEVSASSVASPTGVAISNAAGGTLPAATYFYKVTAISASGQESSVSSEVSQVTAVNTMNTLTWTAVPGAVAYKIYRSAATNAEVFLTTVAVTTFTDANAIAVGAAPAPTAFNSLFTGSTVTVNQGALILNKGANNDALGTGTITLNVGNNIGGQNSAVVQTLAANQFAIGQNQLLTLQSTGQFDLAGTTQTLTPASTQTVLTMTVGPVASSLVTIGNGTLNLNTPVTPAAVADNITVSQSALGFGGTPVPALISGIGGGTLALNGITADTITVNQETSVDSFDISASLTGTDSFSKTSALGNSRMTLSGNNSNFTGNVTVASGELDVTNSNGLGGSAANIITVNAGTTLDLSGGVTIPTTESLILASPATGVGNAGALRSLDSANTWQGPVQLGAVGNVTAGNVTIGVNAGSTLTFGSTLSAITSGRRRSASLSSSPAPSCTAAATPMPTPTPATPWSPKAHSC